MEKASQEEPGGCRNRLLRLFTKNTGLCQVHKDDV